MGCSSSEITIRKVQELRDRALPPWHAVLVFNFPGPRYTRAAMLDIVAAVENGLKEFVAGCTVLVELDESEAEPYNIWHITVMAQDQLEKVGFAATVYMNGYDTGYAAKMLEPEPAGAPA